MCSCPSPWLGPLSRQSGRTGALGAPACVCAAAYIEFLCEFVVVADVVVVVVDAVVVVVVVVVHAPKCARVEGCYPVSGHSSRAEEEGGTTRGGEELYQAGR